jgi:hypothetical protein
MNQLLLKRQLQQLSAAWQASSTPCSAVSLEAACVHTCCSAVHVWLHDNVAYGTAVQLS